MKRFLILFGLLLTMSFFTGCFQDKSSKFLGIWERTDSKQWAARAPTRLTIEKSDDRFSLVFTNYIYDWEPSVDNPIYATYNKKLNQLEFNDGHGAETIFFNSETNQLVGNMIGTWKKIE